MLAQRRRRWANISPALGQRLVFAWPELYDSTMCLINVIAGATTRDQNQLPIITNQTLCFLSQVLHLVSVHLA